MKKNILPRSLFVFLTFCLAFGFVTPAYAQGIGYGDSIPVGSVVDSDVILSGQNVSLDGTVNGNVFILGNQVRVNGTVNGSLFLLAQNAEIDGLVSGTVYATALTLELGPQVALTRDLYVATASLVTQPGSGIQRDLYAIGMDAGLAGKVGRDLHTTIGPLQLYNGLMRLLGFQELTVKLHIELPAPATPTPTSVSPTSTPQSSSSFSQVRTFTGQSALGHYAFRREPPPPTPPSVMEGLAAWALPVLRDWGSLFILGLLALWLLPHQMDNSGTQLRAKALPATAYGLLVLVIAVQLFAVALLLAVFVFMTGLGIGYLGLWGLSVAFWVVGFSCLALAVTALWAFIVYGTKLIVVIMFAAWVLEKLLPAAARYRVLALLLGTLVYVLLGSIPFVGWVIEVLVTAAGMGAAWLAYRHSHTSLPPPEPGSPKKRGRKVALLEAGLS